MKTSKIGSAVLSAIVLSASLSAQEPQGSFSVEIDPATYMFSGYALHLKKSFAALPGWQFGVGVYAMDFPAALVEMTPQNRDKGWEQRLDLGTGLFVDYYFDKEVEGLFVGLQMARQRYEVTQNSKSSAYVTLLSMPYVGYQYTFYEGFYVKPWIGIGYNAKVSGSSEVNDEMFEVPKLVVFPTIHLCYRF